MIRKCKYRNCDKDISSMRRKGLKSNEANI